jgi:hypothetical protein
MAARTIVAQPHAIVGSIGVISAGPRLPRLLDRLGVSVSENRAGYDAQAAALPVLVLRGAAFGTAFWVVYLGVRAARSRVRFKVG